MITLLIILGIVAYIIGFIIVVRDDNDNDFLKGLMVLCFMVVGVCINSLISLNEPHKYNKTKYDFKQEIVLKVVNDSIVKADTLYIITRK